jgi:hypothetical protein
MTIAAKGAFCRRPDTAAMNTIAAITAAAITGDAVCDWPPAARTMLVCDVPPPACGYGREPEPLPFFDLGFGNYICARARARGFAVEEHKGC